MTEYSLTTDGTDYHILTEAARNVKGVPGLSCEIGLRGGGGTKFIIDGMSDTEQTRTHIAIDPYGFLPYPSDKKDDHNYDYTNSLKRETMVALYVYLEYKPTIDFNLYVLEDTEFFSRFADGVPIYVDRKKEIINKYAMVYFDGPHTTSATLEEAKFFAPRAPEGAIFVFDDVVGWYDHSVIKTYLESCGWGEYRTSPTKISYLKIKEE